MSLWDLEGIWLVVFLDILGFLLVERWLEILFGKLLDFISWIDKRGKTLITGNLLDRVINIILKIVLDLDFNFFKI
jgi:hypothetical protein